MYIYIEKTTNRYRKILMIHDGELPEEGMPEELILKGRDVEYEVKESSQDISGIGNPVWDCQIDSVVEDTPAYFIDIKDYKKTKIKELKIEGKKARDDLFDGDQTDLVLSNLIVNQISGSTVFEYDDISLFDKITNTGKACHDEYKRLKTAIDACVTHAEVDAVIATKNFPDYIIE